MLLSNNDTSCRKTFSWRQKCEILHEIYSIKAMHLETNIHKIYIYKSVSTICEIKLVSISTLKNVMFIYIRKRIPNSTNKMICIALPCNLWYKRNKFHLKKITCNKNKSNLKRCLNGERLGIWLTQFRNKRFLPHNKHVRFSLSFCKNNEIILRGKNIERLLISSSGFVGNRMFICLFVVVNFCL